MFKRIINWIFWKLNETSIYEFVDLGGDLSIEELKKLCLKGYYKVGYIHD